MPDAETLAELLSAFKRLDIDGDGTITSIELASYFREVGMAEEDIPAALQLVSGLDKDRDGGISFSEFVSDRMQAMAE